MALISCAYWLKLVFTFLVSTLLIVQLSSVLCYSRLGDDTEMQGMDEFSSVACEMVQLIETATVPIFGVDSGGLINGWNAKIAELTGLQANKAMGKSLVDEVIHEDSRRVVEHTLSRALQGNIFFLVINVKDIHNVFFVFFCFEDLMLCMQIAC